MGQSTNFVTEQGWQAGGLSNHPLHSLTGSSDCHQSSSQSLGQQPHSLVRSHLQAGGNYRSLQAVSDSAHERFLNGRNLTRIEREFSN